MQLVSKPSRLVISFAAILTASCSGTNSSTLPVTGGGQSALGGASSGASGTGGATAAGNPATGGIYALGGTAAVGGQTTGGAAPSGGARASGGSPVSIGGAAPSGGARASGGSAVSSSGGNAPGSGGSGGQTTAGGASGTGGRSGSGGVANSGGTIGVGGATNTGGKIGSGGSAATGGQAASGGTKGSGGATGTGGATGAGGSACTPSCANKTCGSDGCDGTCGGCLPSQMCGTNGTCQAKSGTGISVDASSQLTPISPDIYGVAFATDTGDDSHNVATLDRWGGDAEESYNWQKDMHNSGGDWYCANYVGSGHDADTFVQTNKGWGLNTLMTIPIAGWLANVATSSDNTYSAAIGHNLSYCNSPATSTPTGSDCCKAIGAQESILVDKGSNNLDTSFMANWLSHFVSTFGSAAAGGI